jgi:hypothetical protein
MIGIEAVTVFAGERPAAEIPSYLLAADLLVSPRSRGTNTPLKIYQYLRSGKAIVATRLLTHTQVLSDQTAILTAGHRRRIRGRDPDRAERSGARRGDRAARSGARRNEIQLRGLSGTDAAGLRGAAANAPTRSRRKGRRMTRPPGTRSGAAARSTTAAATEGPGQPRVGAWSSGRPEQVEPHRARERVAGSLQLLRLRRPGDGADVRREAIRRPIGELIAVTQARVLANMIGRIHERDDPRRRHRHRPRRALLARGGARRDRVDASEEMLAVARQRAAEQRSGCDSSWAMCTRWRFPIASSTSSSACGC